MTADQAAMKEIQNLDRLFLEAKETNDPKKWSAYHKAYVSTRAQLLRGFWKKAVFRPREDLDDDG